MGSTTLTLAALCPTLDLDALSVAGDFGVCHFFEGDEDGVAPRRSSLSEKNLALLTEGSSPRITREEAAAALEMEPMSDAGKLTKTEG